MWLLIVVAVVVLAVVIYRSRGERSASLHPERSIVVSFDQREIVAADHTGDTRRVKWDEISKVAIRTTDDGPFAADVFWGIHAGSDDAAIVFPGGSTGESELLRELQRRLPSFRSEELIQAMGSATDAYFVLWQRESSEGGSSTAVS